MENKFKIINTFKDVIIDTSFSSKPLVICDIDHTFIKCLYDINYFYEIINFDKIYYVNNVDLYGAKGSASSVTKVYSKAGYSPDKRTDAKLVANG